MDTWADTIDDEAGPDNMEALLALPDADAAAAWRRRPREPPTAETDLIVAEWGQDWLDTHFAYNNQVDPLAVIQLAREFHADPRSLLAATGAIRFPTTVLVGELDGQFVGPSRKMAATIPGAELVMIGGAYHSPQLTHPEEWRSAVRRHLERVE
jgi:pimeloyl-ACP methyl ester carboxylesterase